MIGTGPTPAEPGDFFGGVFPTGTIPLARNVGTIQFAINVAGDRDVELDKGFTVVLSNASGNVGIGTATADGLIIDEDMDVEVAATDAIKEEGSTGTTDYTFTVTRTGDLDTALTVEYAVTGDGIDPANAADFSGGLPTGTVSFGVGEDTQTVTVTVLADADLESDEGFRLTLSNPSVSSADLDVPAATGQNHQ